MAEFEIESSEGCRWVKVTIDDDDVRIDVDERRGRERVGARFRLREIEGEEVKRLLGSQPRTARGTKLYCLYHADGTPISVSGSLEAAIGSATEHVLMAMSVH